MYSGCVQMYRISIMYCNIIIEVSYVLLLWRWWTSLSHSIVYGTIWAKPVVWTQKLYSVDIRRQFNNMLLIIVNNINTSTVILSILISV